MNFFTHNLRCSAVSSIKLHATTAAVADTLVVVVAVAAEFVVRFVVTFNSYKQLMVVTCVRFSFIKWQTELHMLAAATCCRSAAAVATAFDNCNRCRSWVCVSAPLATPFQKFMCVCVCVKNTETKLFTTRHASAVRQGHFRCHGPMLPQSMRLHIAAAAHVEREREREGRVWGSHLLWHYDFSISIKMPHSNNSSNKGNCCYCCCCNNNSDCHCCNKCATASRLQTEKRIKIKRFFIYCSIGY